MIKEKLRAILVEDEPRSMSVLKKLIEENCSDIHIIATANNVKTAIKAIDENESDIIFLDINLGKANGFEVLDKVDYSEARIIFTTGDESYSLKAFRYNAIDYLLKPIDPKQLVEAVTKISEHLYRKNDKPVDYRALFQKQKISRISLPSLYGYELMDVEDILYCEADGSYTNVFTRFKEKKLVSKPLGYFEEVLCESSFFFRIHKKHIINIKQLVGFTRDKSPEITLTNGTKLNVSSRSRADFFERLKEYAII